MSCQNCLRLGQNEPVVEVVEYADSHLSQRGESHIHASCKSAGSQGQPKRQDLVLICHPFDCESRIVCDGGLPGCESGLSDPAT